MVTHNVGRHEFGARPLGSPRRLTQQTLFCSGMAGGAGGAGGFGETDDPGVPGMTHVMSLPALMLL